MAWRPKWLQSKSPAAPVPAAPARRAVWIAAERNRFGVPVLDLLSITGELISTTTDPDVAARAVAWDGKLVADLPLAFTCRDSLACDLAYTTERDLPDGWLYTPEAMEQKWAFAYRDGAIYAIRSWTGEVKAVARTRRAGERLIVERLELADDALGIFGPPIATFDWLIRSHALRERLPLPVEPEGAAMLEGVPLSVFGPFGHVAACAAIGWAPPPQMRPLRSTGDLTTAARIGRPDLVAALAAAGVPLDARSPVGGFTALHLAVIRGDTDLVERLLALGADPNVLADGAAAALTTAVVHRAPLPILDLLVLHGAIPTTANADSFNMIHAIAETGHSTYLPWALAHGVDLEARTRHGHTPLHIAAALGHVAALRALLASGADRTATDPDGRTARDVARAENKPESLAVFDAL